MYMNTRRTIIYYHQALPLFPFKFSLFGSNVKEYLFYCYIYPLYVKLFLGKQTYVALQTADIKQRFARRYRFPEERIDVFFPETDRIDVEGITPYKYEDGTYNFVYPSIGAVYKEHLSIVYALERLLTQNSDIAKRIRIHFTLKSTDNNELYQYICQHHLESSFVFHGPLPHDQVLSMLKSAEALVFPSVIETFGLPLLEAASLGVPVIANDMEYVREVLHGYSGLNMVKVHDYDEWASMMRSCCEQKLHFPYYQVPEKHSWKRLFDLIRDGEGAKENRVICVLATASAKRGALAIYKQFVHALSADYGQDEWHVFVDVDMPMPVIPQVHYHVIHTKGFGRIWFDLVGFRRYVKKLGVTPDVVFSLQNTGVF
jgi:glycosyltransferase involved in cell wall biosynthesis